MRENGLDPAQVPVVIQFNKRDLPDSKTEAEIEDTKKKGKEAVIGAVAIRGEGVLETLHAVLQQAWRALDARAALHKNIGLSEKEFLTQVFANIDTSGTKAGAVELRRCHGVERRRGVVGAHRVGGQHPALGCDEVGVAGIGNGSVGGSRPAKTSGRLGHGAGGALATGGADVEGGGGAGGMTG